jgi:hypothetical protein
LDSTPQYSARRKKPEEQTLEIFGVLNLKSYCSRKRRRSAAFIRNKPTVAWPIALRPKTRDYCVVHAGIPRIVPGLACDDEFDTGPVLSRPPWCDERPWKMSIEN